jgi:hypothetical protein
LSETAQNTNLGWANRATPSEVIGDDGINHFTAVIPQLAVGFST